MIFACIGGDRRQIETAQFLKSHNNEVILYGLPNINGFKTTENVNEAVKSSDAVILPLPVTKDGKTLNAPLSNNVIFINDILDAKPKFIFGGIIKNPLAESIKSSGIDYCDYYESEALTVKNAVLTAEAAIAIAINGTDYSIFNSKALVIGYGRIGRQLSKYLLSLGASVTATSRDEGTLACILADGITPLDTKYVKEKCSEFDYIFNTAPAPILDGYFFANCKKTAFVEDLATNSGVDLSSAAKYGISADIYGGLPGKHSPVTAAKYIAEEILRKYTKQH